MKRSKRLYAMLGILVVACIATFAVTQTKEEREQIKATGEIVLQVSSDDVQSLSWEYGETSLAFHKDETWLYDEDEAFPVDENTLEGSDYTIAVDGEKDDERIWKYQEDEVAIDALQDALETLDAEYSSDFLSDDPTGKEEIRLTVHLDNENHPKVDIELYRHDGEDCLAVVDGETFALVPRSDVVDLIEAVNAIVLN